MWKTIVDGDVDGWGIGIHSDRVERLEAAEIGLQLLRCMTRQHEIKSEMSSLLSYLSLRGGRVIGKRLRKTKEKSSECRARLRTVSLFSSALLIYLHIGTRNPLATFSSDAQLIMCMILDENNKKSRKCWKVVNSLTINFQALGTVREKKEKFTWSRSQERKICEKISSRFLMLLTFIVVHFYDVSSLGNRGGPWLSTMYANERNVYMVRGLNFVNRSSRGMRVRFLGV